LSLDAFLRRRGTIVAVFAVVVVVAVGVYSSRDGESRVSLPGYAVAPVGSAQGSLDLVADSLSTFELVVRPTARVPTKVVAYLFAIGEGEPNAVDAKIVVTPEGEVHITGRGRALAGAREVRVVVGPVPEFKRFEDALSRAREGTSDDRVRVVVVPIVRQR
jgi:hypothetical protein